MSSPTPFKIYNCNHKGLIAQTKFAEDAMLVAANCDVIVKYGGRVVWNSAKETVDPADSIDEATCTVMARIRVRRASI